MAGFKVDHPVPFWVFVMNTLPLAYIGMREYY